MSGLGLVESGKWPLTISIELLCEGALGGGADTQVMLLGTWSWEEVSCRVPHIWMSRTRGYLDLCSREDGSHHEGIILQSDIGSDQVWSHIEVKHGLVGS